MHVRGEQAARAVEELNCLGFRGLSVWKYDPNVQWGDCVTAPPSGFCLSGDEAIRFATDSTARFHDPFRRRGVTTPSADAADRLEVIAEATHLKTGSKYEMIDPGPGGAVINATNGENEGQRLTLYRAADGQLYVRDEREFCDRFDATAEIEVGPEAANFRRAVKLYLAATGGPSVELCGLLLKTGDWLGERYGRTRLEIGAVAFAMMAGLAEALAERAAGTPEAESMLSAVEDAKRLECKSKAFDLLSPIVVRALCAASS